MTRLLLKCVLLALLVFAASISLKAVYDKVNPLPYYYPSGTIYIKNIYLTKYADKINTLFAGSSTVMREIDPAVFDSLADPALHIQSFNYGVNWMAGAELFYFIDKIRDDSSIHLKYIFIELSKIKFANFRNLNTTRVTHWYNPRDFLFTLKSSLHGNSSAFYKMAAIGSNTVSYASHLLNLGYLSALNDFSITKKSMDDIMPELDSHYTGFSGLEGVRGKEELETNPEEKVMQRTERFLKDTSGLSQRKKWSENEFSKFEKHPELLENYNTVYLQKLNELTEQLMAKGIFPVYLLMPRSENDQYEEMLPVYAHLPANHKIEIADSRKYPELYTVENSLDETHLNIKGARILTALLAEKFSQLNDSSLEKEKAEIKQHF